MTFPPLDAAFAPLPASPDDGAGALEAVLARTMAVCAGASVVSIDVFGALLDLEGTFRRIDLLLEIAETAAPLFDLGPEAFVDLRLRAERAVRTGGGAGRTLAAIDAEFAALLPTLGRLAPGAAAFAEAARLEIDATVDRLRPVASVVALHRRLIAAGRRTVFVADAVLPADVVAAVLHRHDLQPTDGLFVAADRDPVAGPRALFTRVCDHLGVAPRDVVHIGGADGTAGAAAARAAGLVALGTADPAGRLAARLAVAADRPVARPASRLHAALARRVFGSGLVVRRADDTPLPDRIGREVLAPLLLGMASWLHAEVVRSGVPALHFCARDGRVMRRAFDLWRARHGTPAESRYLRVSRQVIYRARVAVDPAAAESLFVQNWSHLAPAEALARWGLDPARLADRIAAAGFADPATPVAIGDPVGERRLRALFAACRDDLEAAAAEHAGLLAAYLAQEGVAAAEAVTLVDIGWHGSLQRGLADLLAAGGWRGRMNGRYLGLFLDAAATRAIDAAGYLFSADGTPRARALRAAPSLVELLHTAAHGSTTGYVRVGDRIEALEEDRPDERAQYAAVLGPIQTAALAFLEEILADPGRSADALDPADAFRGLDRLLNRPTTEELDVLGRLRIADNYGPRALGRPLRPRHPAGLRLWQPHPATPGP